MAKKQPEKEVAKGADKKAATPVKTTSSNQDKKSAKAKGAPKGLRVLLTPFTALGRYFKGAWQELRQVRWPTRRATWALTLAVILFTAFFVLIIVALDSAFQELFNRILL